MPDYHNHAAATIIEIKVVMKCTMPVFGRGVSGPALGPPIGIPPWRMHRTPSVSIHGQQRSACALADADGSHWCGGRGWDRWGMIAEAGEGFAHKGRIRRVELGRGCAAPMCIWHVGYWEFQIGGQCMELRYPGQVLKGGGGGG